MQCSLGTYSVEAELDDGGAVEKKNSGEPRDAAGGGATACHARQLVAIRIC